MSEMCVFVCLCGVLPRASYVYRNPQITRPIDGCLSRSLCRTWYIRCGYTRPKANARKTQSDAQINAQRLGACITRNFHRDSSDEAATRSARGKVKISLHTECVVV